MSGQLSDSEPIQGINALAKAYVSEEVKSFAMKVEIIREVSSVCGPNDFGKSRV
jgi:hypothetical protein